MISDEAIIEYKLRIGSGIFRAEPGDSVIIERDGGALLVPDDETDDAFLSMLEETERTGVDAFSNRYKIAEPQDGYSVQ